MWRLLPDSWLWFSLCSSVAPGDDLCLCGARASTGPMMTNCIQSLRGGPCKCYTMIPDWSRHICRCWTWYLWPVFVMIFLLCFLDVILYFIEVYFDIIVFVTSLFVSDCLLFFPSDPSFCYTFLRVLYGGVKVLLITGPGSAWHLCDAKALAWPVMTSCFELWEGKCYYLQHHLEM